MRIGRATLVGLCLVGLTDCSSQVGETKYRIGNKMPNLPAHQLLETNLWISPKYGKSGLIKYFGNRGTEMIAYYLDCNGTTSTTPFALIDLKVGQVVLDNNPTDETIDKVVMLSTADKEVAKDAPECLVQL